MRSHLCLLACLIGLGLGCRIAPVITEPVLTDPVPEETRYDGCKRAAKEYCAHVVEASKDAMERCVADATFKCVSGGGG